MELEKVLLVENDNGMAHNVLQEFKNKNVLIKQVVNDNQVAECLEAEQFQMVILDWHLDDGEYTSTTARLCLEKIRQKKY